MEDVESVIKELFDVAEIMVIATPELDLFMEKARNLSPDPNDSEYFALALKLGCPIWSNDKALKKQDVVRVYSTKELSEL
ncbi:MAG: hypothetical protein JXB14_01210 [Candidatus Altiarchaeota archaeon]|nr:hypothetical protein [Candidatus Altiarchaeota archaeon]